MVRTKFHSLVLCMLGTVFVKLQHIRHPLTGIMQMRRNLIIEVPYGLVRVCEASYVLKFKMNEIKDFPVCV
jgi:uncharacterized protein (UPF0332 family)